jgi:hypothetical protein
MQVAHSSTSLVALPLGTAVVVLPPPVAVESPLPLLVGKLATVAELAALGELEPPHAASPIAAAATRTASPADRRYVFVPSRLPCALQAALSAL